MAIVHISMNVTDRHASRRVMYIRTREWIEPSIVFIERDPAGLGQRACCKHSIAIPKMTTSDAKDNQTETTGNYSWHMRAVIGFDGESGGQNGVLCGKVTGRRLPKALQGVCFDALLILLTQTHTDVEPSNCSKIAPPPTLTIHFRRQIPFPLSGPQAPFSFGSSFIERSSVIKRFVFDSPLSKFVIYLFD